MYARCRVGVRAIRGSESRRYHSSVQLCWSAQVALQPGVQVPRLNVQFGFRGAQDLAYRFRIFLLALDDLTASLFDTRLEYELGRIDSRNAMLRHRVAYVRAPRRLSEKPALRKFYYKHTSFHTFYLGGLVFTCPHYVTVTVVENMVGSKSAQHAKLVLLRERTLF